MSEQPAANDAAPSAASPPSAAGDEKASPAAPSALAPLASPAHKLKGMVGAASDAASTMLFGKKSASKHSKNSLAALPSSNATAAAQGVQTGARSAEDDTADASKINSKASKEPHHKEQPHGASLLGRAKHGLAHVLHLDSEKQETHAAKEEPLPAKEEAQHAEEQPHRASLLGRAKHGLAHMMHLDGEKQDTHGKAARSEVAADGKEDGSAAPPTLKPLKRMGALSDHALEEAEKKAPLRRMGAKSDQALEEVIKEAHKKAPALEEIGKKKPPVLKRSNLLETKELEAAVKEAEQISVSSVPSGSAIEGGEAKKLKHSKQLQGKAFDTALHEADKIAFDGDVMKADLLKFEAEVEEQCEALRGAEVSAEQQRLLEELHKVCARIREDMDEMRLPDACNSRHSGNELLQQLKQTILDKPAPEHTVLQRSKTMEEDVLASAVVASEKLADSAEVKIDKWLNQALQKLEATKERLLSSPNACVQVEATLVAEKALSSDSVEKLKAAIAQSTYDPRINVADVSADIHVKESKLCCSVRVHSEASVFAVLRALTYFCDDKLTASDMQGALAEVQAVKPQVFPLWPLERMQAELLLEHDCLLSMDNVEELAHVAFKSYMACQEIWEAFREQSPQEAALMEREPAAGIEDRHTSVFYKAKLLPIFKGSKANVLCNEFESLLASRGVSQEGLEVAQMLILNLLDCTDGRAATEAQEQAALITQCVTGLFSTTAMSDCQHDLATSLMREVHALLVEAGATGHEASSAIGHVQSKTKERLHQKAQTTTSAALQLEICKAQARSAKMPFLPNAGVLLLAKLPDDVADVDTAALGQLKDAVMHGVAPSSASKQDISIHVQDHHLRCDLSARSCASVLSMVEALDTALHTAGDKCGIQAALAALKASNAQVLPRWPLERIQMEILLRYGYFFEISQLEKMVPALAKSRNLYREVWEGIRSRAPEDVSELLNTESMTRFEDKTLTSDAQLLVTDFKDKLLPISVGREQNLLELYTYQGADNVVDLMSDAEKAQHKLKSDLAAGTEWALAVLNDPEKVPQGDPSRTWVSGDDHTFPSAAHYDPGVKSQERTLQKARNHMNELDVEVPVDSLVDVSRLGITFESVKSLLTALYWTLHNLDVLWLDNKFRSPSCLGYRDLTIGVRQYVSTSPSPEAAYRAHISELHFALREMSSIKHKEGRRLHDDIRSILDECGTAAKDLEGVETLILNMMDYTDDSISKCVKRRAADVAHSLSIRSSTSDYREAPDTHVQALIHELVKWAVSAGNPETDVKREVAHAQSRAQMKVHRKSQHAGSTALQVELRKAQARNQQLSALPAAGVQVTADLAADSALQYDKAALEVLSQAVALAAAPHHVRNEDIRAKVEDGKVLVDIGIVSTASVRAVVEELTKTLHGESDACGLQAACSSSKVTNVEISPRWPLEQIQVEIQLKYGYTLDISQLEKLVQAVSSCDKAYSKVWHEFGSNTEEEVQRLLQKESMSRFEDPQSLAPFGDQLLTISEGKKQQLLEVWASHGAHVLEDVMADAELAQSKLKAALAPETDWANAVLNDTQKVPPDDPLRTWTSSEDHAIPWGDHYDPGIKGMERVLEEARNRMNELDTEPPVHTLVNISRASITFESLSCLQKALDWITAHFDILWIDNKYRNPSCLGYRDMSVGFRWLVQAADALDMPQRVHVSELQLRLRAMHYANDGEGRYHHEAMRDAMREILDGCGVTCWDFNGVQELILRMLDCTDGRTAEYAKQELKHLSSSLETLAERCSWTSYEAELSQKLLREAKARARCAGISHAEIALLTKQAKSATRSLAGSQIALPKSMADSQISLPRSMAGTATAAQSAKADFLKELQNILDDEKVRMETGRALYFRLSPSGGGSGAADPTPWILRWLLHRAAALGMVVDVDALEADWPPDVRCASAGGATTSDLPPVLTEAAFCEERLPQILQSVLRALDAKPTGVLLPPPLPSWLEDWAAATSSTDAPKEETVSPDGVPCISVTSESESKNEPPAICVAMSALLHDPTMMEATADTLFGQIRAETYGNWSQSNTVPMAIVPRTLLRFWTQFQHGGAAVDGAKLQLEWAEEAWLAVHGVGHAGEEARRQVTLTEFRTTMMARILRSLVGAVVDGGALEAPPAWLQEWAEAASANDDSAVPVQLEETQKPDVSVSDLSAMLQRRHPSKMSSSSPPPLSGPPQGRSEPVTSTPTGSFGAALRTSLGMTSTLKVPATPGSSFNAAVADRPRLLTADSLADKLWFLRESSPASSGLDSTTKSKLSKSQGVPRVAGVIGINDPHLEYNLMREQAEDFVADVRCTTIQEIVVTGSDLGRQLLEYCRHFLQRSFNTTSTMWRAISAGSAGRGDVGIKELASTLYRVDHVALPREVVKVLWGAIVMESICDPELEEEMLHHRLAHIEKERLDFAQFCRVFETFTATASIHRGPRQKTGRYDGNKLFGCLTDEAQGLDIFITRSAIRLGLAVECASRINSMRSRRNAVLKKLEALHADHEDHANALYDVDHELQELFVEFQEVMSFNGILGVTVEYPYSEHDEYPDDFQVEEKATPVITDHLIDGEVVHFQELIQEQRVVQVTPGGRAAKAGVLVGSRVVSMGIRAEGESDPGFEEDHIKHVKVVAFELPGHLGTDSTLHEVMSLVNHGGSFNAFTEVLRQKCQRHGKPRYTLPQKQAMWTSLTSHLAIGNMHVMRHQFRAALERFGMPIEDTILNGLFDLAQQCEKNLTAHEAHQATQQFSPQVRTLAGSTKGRSAVFRSGVQRVKQSLAGKEDFGASSNTMGRYSSTKAMEQEVVENFMSLKRTQFRTSGRQPFKSPRSYEERGVPSPKSAWHRRPPKTLQERRCADDEQCPVCTICHGRGHLEDAPHLVQMPSSDFVCDRKLENAQWGGVCGGHGHVSWQCPGRLQDNPPGTICIECLGRVTPGHVPIGGHPAYHGFLGLHVPCEVCNGLGHWWRFCPHGGGGETTQLADLRELVRVRSIYMAGVFRFMGQS